MKIHLLSIQENFSLIGLIGSPNDLILQPDIDGLFTTRTAFQVDAFAKLIKDAIQVCSLT